MHDGPSNFHGAPHDGSDVHLLIRTKLVMVYALCAVQIILFRVLETDPGHIGRENSVLVQEREEGYWVRRGDDTENAWRIGDLEPENLIAESYGLEQELH